MRLLIVFAVISSMFIYCGENVVSPEDENVVSPEDEKESEVSVMIKYTPCVFQDVAGVRISVNGQAYTKMAVDDIPFTYTDYGRYTLVESFVISLIFNNCGENVVSPEDEKESKVSVMIKYVQALAPCPNCYEGHPIYAPASAEISVNGQDFTPMAVDKPTVMVEGGRQVDSFIAEKTISGCMGN